MKNININHKSQTADPENTLIKKLIYNYLIYLYYITHDFYFILLFKVLLHYLFLQLEIQFDIL